MSSASWSCPTALGRVTAVAHKKGRHFSSSWSTTCLRGCARPLVIAHELGHHMLTLALRLGLPEACEEGVLRLLRLPRHRVLALRMSASSKLSA